MIRRDNIDDLSGIEGEWEDGFAPAVRELVRISGAVYAPFLAANARAIAAGEAEFSMQAMGLNYSQGSFKYQVRCLADLKARYGELDLRARTAVDPILGPDWIALLA